MKISNSFKVLIILMVASLVTIRVSYTCGNISEYKPIYLAFDEFRNAVDSQPARSLKNPGKILVKDHLIFINEPYKGVHVIDNSNPTTPESIAFINIPGNIDIAMKGETLYADSYVDLIALDVSDPAEVVVTQRLENIYPNQPFVDQDWIYWSEEIDPEKGVVIDKELVSTGGGSCGDSTFIGCGGSASSDSAASASSESTGINGSLARITIVNDYLYLLAGSDLKTVSIIEQQQPRYINSVQLSFDIETLYPYDDALFVGGQTGVQIIGISTPNDPELLSKFQHEWQCDPVVVNGDTAYVTLRGGSNCRGWLNQLDILDVSDLTAPTLIKSYPMNNPYGLAIDDQTLFLADGDFGLRIFNVENPHNIEEIRSFPGKPANDIILYESRIHVVGSNGFYQYNYSQLGNIVFLSHIPIVK